MTHLGRFSSNIRFWFITFLYVVWLAPETWIVAKATPTQQWVVALPCFRENHHLYRVFH